MLTLLKTFLKKYYGKIILSFFKHVVLNKLLVCHVSAKYHLAKVFRFVRKVFFPENFAIFTSVKKSWKYTRSS